MSGFATLEPVLLVGFASDEPIALGASQRLRAVLPEPCRPIHLVIMEGLAESFMIDSFELERPGGRAHQYVSGPVHGRLFSERAPRLVCLRGPAALASCALVLEVRNFLGPQANRFYAAAVCETESENPPRDPRGFSPAFF